MRSPPFAIPSCPTLCFIGVSTGQSLINRLFPIWADVLGVAGTELLGIDLPLDAEPAAVREVVDILAAAPTVRGALVTTHKMAVFAHARDCFGGLDPMAEALGEISAISKRDGELIGHAKDPITVGLALAEIAPTRYWQTNRKASGLIMGAGGASLALAAHVLGRPASGRPAAITLTDVDQRRLDHADQCLSRLGGDAPIRFRLIQDPQDHDAMLAEQPSHTLIVNGTGLGKDRPGSPLTDAARFPQHAVAWEFNYRGTLDFLGQARAQQASQDLQVHDGWAYFLHGWAHVIAEVFDCPLDDETFAALARAADPLRPQRATALPEREVV